MSRVKVACRVRPALDVKTGEELAEDSAVEVVSSPNSQEERRSLRFQDGLTFTIDHVYDQKSSQKQVFDSVALPLVGEAFRGFNCTLFSYGQTGSGKTYTLQGKPGEESRGIVPRTAEAIFDKMAELQHKNGTEEEVICEMRLSVMEIYQERLKDLLSTQTSSAGGAWGQAGGSMAGTANLRIREHMGGSVWVQGLTEVPVTDIGQFQELMGRAFKKRATGSHAMNMESSRSHLVCIMNLRQSKPHAGQRISSKVHLIDLAGSEMVRKTDASGQRMAEAKHINKSLSALGNVINALTAPGMGRSGDNDGSDAGDAIRRATHVPFRDSKLTRLLQDSLGGNAKTVLVLAISESQEHVTESVNTLRFGERARQLCTKPTVNSDIVMDERKLRAALARAEAQIVALTETIDTQAAVIEEQKHSQPKGRGSETSKSPATAGLAPGFSGTLGTPGGLSPLPVEYAREVEVVVEEKVVYVEKEPDEYFCQQCAVVLTEIAQRVPVQQIGGCNKGKDEEKRGDNSRASSAGGGMRGGSSSGSRAVARRAPNLNSSSFKNLKQTAATSSSTTAATNKKDRNKHEVGEKQKADVADLGLLGHWEQQQRQQKGKLTLPGTTPTKGPLSPLCSARGKGKTEGRSSPRGRAMSRKKNKSERKYEPTITVGVDLEPMRGQDPGIGGVGEGKEALLLGSEFPRAAHQPPLPKSPGMNQEQEQEEPPVEQGETGVVEDAKVDLAGQEGGRGLEGHGEEDFEADGRCFVCGLDDDEASALGADTGELMGSLFMCDGNCGHSYHARCVGLVTAKGEYEVPQGEWFCSNCTLDEEPEGDSQENMVTPRMSTPGETLPTVASPGGGAPQVSRLKAEYHSMRIERNRVLTQWQQEKRVQALVEEKNRNINKKREEEHSAVMERFQLMEKELDSEKAEATRLRTLCDELMASLKEANSSTGTGVGGGYTIAAAPTGERTRRTRLKRPVFDVVSTRETEGGSESPADGLSPAETPQMDEEEKEVGGAPFDEGMAVAHHLEVASKLDKHADAVSAALEAASDAATRSMPPTLRGEPAPPPTACDSPSTDATNGHKRLTESGMLEDSEDLESSYESVTGSMSAGSSKLKGRLRDLLRTVKEEAGSYAEIRAQREQKLEQRRAMRESR